MGSTILAVATTGMLGVLVGHGVNDVFGGKRSSVGVHKKNGQIMPFDEGVVVYALIIVISGLVTALVARVLTSTITGLGALFVSVVGIVVFLSVDSYSR